jgi:hypothetical protein
MLDTHAACCSFYNSFLPQAVQDSSDARSSLIAQAVCKRIIASLFAVGNQVATISALSCTAPYMLVDIS